MISPKEARAKLDLLTQKARDADWNEFRHTTFVGGLSLTIKAGASRDDQVLFFRGSSRIIDKSVALQLIEVYGG